MKVLGIILVLWGTVVASYMMNIVFQATGNDTLRDTCGVYAVIGSIVLTILSFLTIGLTIAGIL
jgi:hypothetical protein